MNRRRGHGAPREPAHLVVVVDTATDSAWVAGHAGRMAAALRCTMTVLLRMERPWMALAFDPLVMPYCSPEDLELDMLVHLSRLLDDHAVTWSLEAVASSPIPAIRRLVGGDPACRVIVARSRWPYPLCRGARLERALRRLGLPVHAVRRHEVVSLWSGTTGSATGR